jgi:rare lipoprotein A
MRNRVPLRLLAGKLAVAFALAGTTVSCGEPTPKPPTPPAIPVGVVAIPRPAAVPGGKVVAASYYARHFDGRITTSGEVYNPNKLTAASKTLPLGSVVELKNPKNQRIVRVKVNDRGPFIAGRSLDLSHRAADELGIVKQGVAPVRIVKIIPPAVAATAKTRHSPSNPQVKLARSNRHATDSGN